MDKGPPKPRRTRQKVNALHYESLPTAPPAMCGRAEENIFQFPAVASRARNLSASPNYNLSDEKDLPACAHGKHSCFFCQPYRADRGTIEPLKIRLNSAIEAMDELNHTYALLEGFLEKKLATIIDTEKEDPIRLDDNEQRSKDVSLVLKEEDEQSDATISQAAVPPSDTEFELEHSLTWLESLLGTEIVPPFKQGKFKRIRERSKSMMEDEINMYIKNERPLKTSLSRPYLLRRQSTYSDNKSKVSKWTKVKAAFKWERANVPPSGSAQEANVLLPVNNDVERYLKVPVTTAGGSSSADSIISSSSGHFMSDTGGTPGTISSASSMDELDATCRHNMRRDSSKSDTRCDSRASNFEVELRKSVIDERLDSMKSALPIKSSSNKSLRRSKAFSDFEVLPEDHVAEIKSTSTRRQKLPPSPLNLSQVCSDLPQLHSPLKSPKDQTLPRMRRVNSPGNSSVPSSPSRHSDFFGEFESEDLSSGDFSEPTTPNRKNEHDEIFQRYQLLVLKLDMEFKHKQCGFERSNTTNRSVKFGSGSGGSGSGKRSSEEHSPTQLLHNELMSTEQLEQNLTPQFKKKLHKWRAKQQSCYNAYASSDTATSPTAKHQSSGGSGAADAKPKIDWNLWSLGQLKLEGQGLCALPDQKDLPEKFQKKMEQWNRLKCSPGTNSDNDSLKRGSKHSQSTRRGSDDDRWYKHKSHDKEKLARLKAIVAPDHTSKKIEVKTSAGEVMKFEGISRKFTRKLYEWEKARGIGPEASTFALLHPGYCPIDVRRINKECNKATAEDSPALSRSLSLDSVSPSVNVISQQASSLSLNHVNDLKEIKDSTDALTDHEFKKYDEPEAVMVEVEEHIHDTASPLVTAHTLVEQQTPIYKYEEVQCNDYVNSRRVQSFESHTNLAPLLGALKRADELFEKLKNASPDLLEHAVMRDCQSTLLSIRNIYPYYSNNLMKANVLNAVSDVQSELGRLSELSQKSPLDEACCQETMQERTMEYLEEIQGMLESLQCLKLSIQGGSNRYPRDIVPDINITADDGQQIESTCDNSSRDQLAVEDQSGASHMEHETETSTTTGTLCRSSVGAAGNSHVNAAKKKLLRLRKMGSRQNSKTESDSSDAETHSVLETPRRLRRKNFRLKQRSLDDDFRLGSCPPIVQGAASEIETAPAPVAVIHGSLKVKPGELIEQSQSIAPIAVPPSKLGGFVPPPLPELHTRSYNTNANVFVKTKRKLFTTIAEPNALEGIAVIEKELESPTFSIQDNEKPTIETVNVKSKSVPRPLNLYKSISLDRLTPRHFRDDPRKCQSSENLCRRSIAVPLPLASDSMQRLLQSKRSLRSTPQHPSCPEVPPRRVHLYKKHSLHKSHSATVSNNIEHKIAKTSSGSMVAKAPIPLPEPLVLPNKLDNTLPRIQRKLEGKTTSLTPTKPKQFEFPPSIVSPTDHRPATPLSERAQRLQQAKTQFLQSAPVTPRQEPTTPTTSHDPAPIHKSISAGSIRGGEHQLQQQQQEVKTDQESVGSLPRVVTRSGKISSKLGFATLASKLRRGGRKPKEPPATAMHIGSALSALCRQTLMADVIALPQVLGGERPPPPPPASPRTPSGGGNVHKSQSTPQAACPHSPSNYDGLNKSLSEQYVRQLKESDV